MDLCLWDLLYEWAFCHYPPLLNDEQAFRNLHDLIHLLLEKQRKELHARMYDRLRQETRASNN